MSINEIIKTNLLIKNLKLPKLTTKVTHCQNRTSDYCSECHEHKTKICNEKLTYQSIKQVSNKRWHLYFLCSKNHLIIRWITSNDNQIIIGNLKN